MDDGPERYRVRFATGDTISVRKRRSFRDRERNDIERDLPGWPPGKPFAVRGFFRKSGLVVFMVTMRILALPFIIILDALGASPVSEERRGELEERENEIDDFPVMWAGEGDRARTLPWQLDPSRRPWRTVTEIELGESEEFVRITSYEETSPGRWGFSWGEVTTLPGSEAVLWTSPRRDIAGAAVKTFSVGQVDFTITFRDGSWTRLAATSSTGARKIVDLLNGVRKEDADDRDDRDHADAEPPVPPG
ncbi:hypothetical protein GCM10010400_10660 [Streptomyces aculeolatus]|uniref:hypothetical protein n=1 Tax=Streptomyces aculeolatus TaxID=270689 RepID=UPI001CEDCC3A|nr:hypothetical protein [Streptomyces aculeolatus]